MNIENQAGWQDRPCFPASLATTNSERIKLMCILSSPSRPSADACAETTEEATLRMQGELLCMDDGPWPRPSTSFAPHARRRITGIHRETSFWAKL